MRRPLHSTVLDAIAEGWGASPPPPSERSWRMVIPGERRLPVTLAWNETDTEGSDLMRCSVHLDPWLHTFEESDAAAVTEVTDLIAAALFGGCRQRVFLGKDGNIRGGVLEFLGPAGWREHARWGRRGWGWSRERVLQNDLRPRWPVMEGLGLRHAPWVGVTRGWPSQSQSPVEIPLDGVLDLHTYAPKDVGPLVREYIDACRARGVVQLRVIHGKGRGQLRRTVHAELSRHPAVRSFRLGSVGEGSWGATIVDLVPVSSAG